MITQETYVTIHVLHKQGLSIRAIAGKLGLSRNTVRRHLAKPSELPRYQKRPKRPAKLDAYKDYIHERIQAAKPHWIPAAVLFREIKALGYEGGSSMVRVYVSQLKPTTDEAITRFETEPGQQLQVDFTTIRRGKRSLKAFVATLGYSRATFVRFTDAEKQDDWLEGIEGACSYFGGVAREILFDNAKCIMIERDAYGDGKHRWNPSLLEQARRLGYRPKACRPYRAKTKGKVERFNRYLKESFITPLAASLKTAGLELTTELANAHVGPWLSEVAQQRIHGTTGVKPAKRLADERLVLLPFPSGRQEPSVAQNCCEAVPFESLQHPLHQYDLVRGIAYEPSI